MKIVALDFETMSIHRDSAYQIGVTVLNGDKVGVPYQALFRPVNPDRTIYYRRRTGPALQEILDAPAFAEVWARAWCRMKGADIVCAHRAHFDRGVLLASLARAGLDPGRMQWVCTHSLAKRMWNLHPCKLADVLTHLGIRSWAKVRHQAGPDSRHCAQIMRAAMAGKGWRQALRASMLDEPASAIAVPAPGRVRRTYAQILHDALPEDGSAVGQIALRNVLGWDVARFASARGQLLPDSKIRIGPGQGGTLARVMDDVVSVTAALPLDGSRIGRSRLHRELGWGDRRFAQAVQKTVDSGVAGLGPGRGGSLFRRQAA